MMDHRAQIGFLPDGRRLYLQDGPIDLILEGFGSPQEIEKAYRAASSRFVTLLDELCSELSILRQAFRASGPQPKGVVAQRMAAAVANYATGNFITPMAAVAGAVAEEILGAMNASARLDRAYVNDGGDIAIHLARSQRFAIGMVELDRPSLWGSAILDFEDPIRGIATSGWRGRSFSLGIADAVTVLADTAAGADAAATIIANAVDLPGHSEITRARACDLSPDSDLGDRLVTQYVGHLTACEVATALRSGEAVADSLLSRNLIRAAALHLRDETCIVGETLRQQTLIAGNHWSLVHA
jgi:uncharacterized protein